MSYPKEHESLVRASYSSLIESGVSPCLARLASEIIGRDAAGIPRSQVDQDYIDQIVRHLNENAVDLLQDIAKEAA